MPVTPPTDYGLETQSIERSRRLADLMRQASMEPAGNPMSGGWAVPISPFQGINKIAQGYVGEMGQRQADERQMALVNRLRGEAQDFMTKMPQGAGGQPPSRQEMQAYLMRGAVGGNPLVSPMASQLATKYMTPASEDALLRRQTTLETHATPSGSAQLGAQARMGAAQLGADTSQANTQARIAQQQHQWENPSAYQTGRLQQGQQGLAQGQQRIGLQTQQLGISAGHLANEGARLGFETGIQGSGAPRLNAMPQGQPQPMPQAQGAPQGQAPVIQQVTPKERQALIVAQPQTLLSAQRTLQTSKRLMDAANELQGHPGLSGITGLVHQYSALDVTPQTRAARALQKTITSQVGIEALQAMRAASKSGGAVGQVTEKEWPILQQSIAALDSAQGTADYQIALKNLTNQVKASMDNVRAAYELTYGPANWNTGEYVNQGRGASGGWSVVR